MIDQGEFWNRVQTTKDCWLWLGPVNHKGYGRYKQQMAHRIAYELIQAPIPEGFTIDHLCKNRACVNPAHLEAVTGKVNTLRGTSFSAVNAAKTHCANGHLLSGDNLLKMYKGRRKCKACNKAQAARYKNRARRLRRAAARG